MNTKFFRLAPVVILLSLSQQACKKTEPNTSGPSPSAQADQAPVTAAVLVASAPVAAAAPPFDFNTVPETTSSIPSFPYVDYPPKVNESSQHTTTLPMDNVDVILGAQLHHLEGKVTIRTFSHRDAAMSELEVRRNYQNAVQSFGAVKVNVDQPGVHYTADKRMDNLRPLAYDMSYDVYLARKGAARHWIVVMTSDDTTRLLSIEEMPFVQTIGYEGSAGKPQSVTATGAPPAAPEPLDINALPVHTAPLPPFPYLAYPGVLNESQHKSKKASFDAVSFIAGKQLRTIEGKVETREFSNREANISQMAARRNYEAAVTGLGAVKVSAIAATAPDLIAANGKEYEMRDKLRIPLQSMSYDSYLLRAPGKNIWMALMFTDDRTSFVVVEEKAMEQSVTLVTADTMRTELAAKGHIPLYINFDIDRATIRADGKPAVDEIATLLKNDAKLRLSIEGHTDNSGDAKHNVELSRQRAEAVVRQLVTIGIDAGRLQAAGKGAATPLADNKDEAGRAQNRRVELVKL